MKKILAGFVTIAVFLFIGIMLIGCSGGLFGSLSSIEQRAIEENTPRDSGQIYDISIVPIGDLPVGNDSVTATPASGKHGAAIILNYTLVDADIYNWIEFTLINTTIEAVHESGTGQKTYILDAGDADEGTNVIKIYVKFTHVNRVPNKIEFEDSSLVINKTYGMEPFINKIKTEYEEAGREITYSSSVPSVASVNSATGEVTILKSGSSVISAAKAGDSYWAEATAQYTLQVVMAEPLAPGIPRYAGNTQTTVVLQEPSGANTAYFVLEYSCSENRNAPSTTWQESKTFDSLNANTAYYFFARYKAVEFKNIASPHSTALEVYTSQLITCTIKFKDNSINKTYGDAAFNNTVTLTPPDATGTITYSANNNTAITLNPGTGQVTINQASDTPVTITVTKAGSMTHAPAQDSYTLYIDKRTLTVTGASHTKPYDGNTNAVGVTVTLGNIYGSDSVSAGTVTAAYTSANALTTSLNITGIVLTGAAAGNYKVTVPVAVTVAGITRAAGAGVNTPTVSSVTENSITVNTVAPPGNGQTVEYAISNASNGTGLSTYQTNTTFSRTPGTHYVYARSAQSANYNAGTPSVSAAITFHVVTFDKNGGTTEANPQTKVVLSPATNVGTLPTPPTRTGGYKFNGWTMNANGTGGSFTAATTVTNSFTVYAQWLAGYSGNPDYTWYNPANYTFNLKNADELAGLAYLVNSDIDSFAGKTVSLLNDVDLSIYGSTYRSGKGWMPVGKGWDNVIKKELYFGGTFNGNGYTISGLFIDSRNDNYPSGFFGEVFNATINNLKLAVDIIGIDSVGGVAGLSGNYSTISGCTVSGSVIGIRFLGVDSSNVGGIVGATDFATISNCIVTATVFGGHQNVGGIVGLMGEEGSINGCSVSGSVTSRDGSLGGIVGKWNVEYNTGCSINNCSVSGPVLLDASGSGGEVYSGSQIGGIAGYLNNVKVSNCYTTGTVAGVKETGGIAGRSHNSEISFCYSTGTVSGESDVGGIAGYLSCSSSYDSIIRNCFSTDNISASFRNAGGIVGYSNNNSKIYNCYSTGAVNASSGYCAGGIAGVIKGYVTNCYATGEISGPEAVGGIAAETINGYLLNCVALNPRITKTGNASNDFGRLLGAFGGTTNSNNYSRNSMTLPAGAVGINGTGQNTPLATTFWTTAGNWNTTTAPATIWDFTTVWEWNTNNLPKLRNMPGNPAQNHGLQ